MSLLGVSLPWEDLRDSSLMSLCPSFSYVVIKDFEGKDYLVMENAGNDLWPKLLYQYSNTGHTRPLPMVKGSFTSISSEASSSRAA